MLRPGAVIVRPVGDDVLAVSTLGRRPGDELRAIAHDEAVFRRRGSTWTSNAIELIPM
jgi:hypothetical protein